MAINLHAAQSKIFHDMFVSREVRNGVGCCARGFGKSFLGAAAASKVVGELVELPAWVPNKNISIVCPTYSQTVDIYYPLLAYQFGLESWATKSSRDSGYFRFPNHVELRLVSGDAIERQRGKGNAFVLVDELTSFNMKEQAKMDMIESVLLPTITTRWSPKRVREFEQEIYNESGDSVNISPGRFMCISTPTGWDAFYDLYNRQNDDPNWRSYQYDYLSSPYLDEEEISKAADTMDPIRFAREYKATFQDSGNNVFYMFDRELNVLRDGAIVPGDGEPIHIAIDFNVRKQCSSVWVKRGNIAGCFDFLQGSADTEQLAATIFGRYVQGTNRPAKSVYCYPDPSGRAAKTSAVVGTTDFTILESYGFSVLAKSAHPGIIDSVNSANARFRTADNPITKQKGQRFAFVSAKCKPVIESLTRTQWVDKNSDTAMIDKSQDIEHMSDGIRYFFDYHWPIQHKRTAKRGFAF
jgi:hypothetical protein